MTGAPVWYHLYPLGFLGAPAANDLGEPVEHRLRELPRWLDHLGDLDVTGVVLGPVFESLTHGYDTIDHRRVDRRLGDEDDLVAFLAACHERGLVVVLDGVFNHVGRRFAPFLDVVEHRDRSRYAPWFRCRFDRPGTDGFACDTFEGHDALVALNHDDPEVLEYVAGVAEHWMERGADGFRLDAAYAVPTSFWRGFSDRVRRIRADAYLLGEVIHGDYSRFVERSGVDSVTQYELWKAIWSALNDGNLFELAHALERHAAFCATFVPYTFVGNHDVTRIATQLRDPHHLPLALAVLFTVPGTPAVYAGDESGATGLKRDEAGGDDEIRRPFTPRPDSPVHQLHRELIALRRSHPWLTTGVLRVVDVANGRLVYEVAALAGGSAPLRVELVLDGARSRWSVTPAVPPPAP